MCIVQRTICTQCTIQSLILYVICYSVVGIISTLNENANALIVIQDVIGAIQVFCYRLIPFRMVYTNRERTTKTNPQKPSFIYVDTLSRPESQMFEMERL